MVSFNTILIIGALIVASVLVIGAGGPAGVGQKIGAGIGGGLRQFSEQLQSAFSFGLFGGSAGASNVGSQQGTVPASDPSVPTTTAGQFLDVVNPITSQLGIFQAILDQLKNIGNFGQQAFGDRSNLTPNQTRTTAFALSQLREGQTISDLIVRPRQGTAVARTGMRFVTNLGGRERAFGSQESLNSFIERFNR